MPQHKKKAHQQHEHVQRPDDLGGVGYRDARRLRNRFGDEQGNAQRDADEGQKNAEKAERHPGVQKPQAGAAFPAEKTVGSQGDSSGSPGVMIRQGAGQEQQDERAGAPVHGVANPGLGGAERASGRSELQKQSRQEGEHELIQNLVQPRRRIWPARRSPILPPNGPLVREAGTTPSGAWLFPGSILLAKPG